MLRSRARTPLVLVAVAAATAGAQAAKPEPRLANQVMLGHPINLNPPTLPLRQPVPPLRLPGTSRNVPIQQQRPRNVTYIPAAIPYGYMGPAEPQQNVNVSVNNYIETPPAVTYVNAYPVSVVNPGLRLWDPDADIAREREQAVHSSFAAFDPDRPAPVADSADVRSMDAIVSAFYDVLSGPRGASRNWERFRTLFVDNAHLIVASTEGQGVARTNVMSIAEYANAAAPVLERGVFEKEVARSVQQFGTIAHVFSTFECRRMSGDEKAYQRGINSLQLLNDGKRWWITSVTWDAERPENPIPAKYLPAMPPAAKK